MSCGTGSPGPAGTLYDVPFVCGDVLPNASCSGPLGPQYMFMGYINANTWVFASPNGTCSDTQFVEAALLPTTALIQEFDSTQAYNTWLAASSYTFGAGSAFTPPFDVSQLSAPQMTFAFAAGVVLVVGWAAIGKTVELLLNTIRGRR